METEKELARDTVYGYIHNTESALLSKKSFIPNDVINLILLYYFLLEKWDPDYHGENIFIKDDIATFTAENTEQSAFGVAIIDTITHPNTVWEWTLKIHQRQGSTRLYIGIFEMDKMRDIFDRNCFLQTGSISKKSTDSMYSVTYIPEGKDGYCKTIITNKEIMVKLVFDTKSKILKYYVNDFYFAEASNINTNRKYQLAVCFHDNNTSLEIIDLNVYSL